MRRVRLLLAHTFKKCGDFLNITVTIGMYKMSADSKSQWCKVDIVRDGRTTVHLWQLYSKLPAPTDRVLAKMCHCEETWALGDEDWWLTPTAASCFVCCFYFTELNLPGSFVLDSNSEQDAEVKGTTGHSCYATMGLIHLTNSKCINVAPETLLNNI